MATILAVDDSETMRQMVKQTLQAGNHQVVLADDGEDGLSKYLSTAGVDLIITDINMPKMDGIGLIKEIRMRNATIPILALTTESEDEMRKKGAEAGANGWLVKPFKPAQFIDIVRQIL